MRMVVLAGMLAGLTTLVGCAALDSRDRTPEQIGAGPCKARVCVVMVTVKDCEVTVDDPEKVVPRDNVRPTLRFRLDRESHWRFEFADDAIAFKNDPGGQMRPLGPSFLKTEFDVVDINDARGRYEYRLKVKRRFGEVCPTKDWWVVNN